VSHHALQSVWLGKVFPRASAPAPAPAPARARALRRARARTIRLDYDHEHRVAEHEHEFLSKTLSLACGFNLSGANDLIPRSPIWTC